METFTVHSQLIAKEVDVMDYQLLVFKILDNQVPFGHQYCMVTVFPNWESRIPEIGEIGYVNYDEVIAGEDKWYDLDTDKFIPYNYTNLIFKKFVKEQDNSTKDIII